MMILEDRIAAILPEWRARTSNLLKKYGDRVVDQITVNQIYRGMRGAKVLVTDISYVDPNEGIRYRGFTIPELMDLLPKSDLSEYPLAGGLYYLLLVGEIPTNEEAIKVENDWRARSGLPPYVFETLKALPEDTHPMTMFSQAILTLQHESIFAKKYRQGIRREEYWIATLEDSMQLIAKLPTIAAYIYSLKYGDGGYISPNPDLDWSANFAHMIGNSNPDYMELIRLYFFLHSDHESGNVSAHTAHLVGSSLSDVYYSCAAGINGLAGPLHGLANQETLRWLLQLYELMGGLPSKERLKQFTLDTLSAGKVIPGYGHAVLRIPDPRFTAQYKFGKKYLVEDELFQLVDLVYKVVPDVLKNLGKVKNPWPNVDAISGSLQYYYGIKYFDFYTVLFGVSRILGVTANMIWARALGQPIERPKSITTEMLEKLVKQ